MTAHLREMGRWALVPLAPVLFIAILAAVLWRERGDIVREGITNAIMVVVLFALGMTSVVAIAGF